MSNTINGYKPRIKYLRWWTISKSHTRSRCHDNQDLTIKDDSRNRTSPSGGDLMIHYVRGESVRTKTTKPTYHTRCPEGYLGSGNDPEDSNTTNKRDSTRKETEKVSQYL